MDARQWIGFTVAVLLAVACGGCRHGDSLADVADDQPPQPAVETVVTGLQEPVALVFLSPASWLVAERHTGRILRIEDGKLRSGPFATLPVPTQPGDAGYGLLDLAVAPGYPSPPYVYAYYTVTNGDGAAAALRVVRYTVKNGVGVNPQIIIDDLPAGDNNGGRLLFGDDGKLYLTLGDTGQQQLAQDYTSPVGKVLRYNTDGSIPADNPLEQPQTGWAGNPDDDSKQLGGEKTPIYTIGHRDPLGIAMDPDTGLLYLLDSGPGRDNIYALVAGDNYGWPNVTGVTTDPRYHAPLWSSGANDIVPSGAAFYTGAALPQFRGNLLFASQQDGKLRRAIFAGPNKIAAVEVIPAAGDRARLDVAMGKDGELYFTSQDSIYRLTAGRGR